MDAKQRLADALTATGLDDPRLETMIQRARDGYYHDTETPHAFPIMTLVNDLIALGLDDLGLDDLAGRAQRGDFDATSQDLSDWYHSPDGQAALNELAGGAAHGG